MVERYDEARTAIEDALAANRAGDDHIGERLNGIYSRTLEAMLDDLNTPVALATALEGAKLIRGFKDLNNASANSAKAWLDKTNELLGFLLPVDDALGKAVSQTNGTANGTPTEIQALLDERTEARKSRDFTRSDALREQIEALGYEVMDTPDGAKVKKRLAI